MIVKEPTTPRANSSQITTFILSLFSISLLFQLSMENAFSFFTQKSGPYCCTYYLDLTTFLLSNRNGALKGCLGLLIVGINIVIELPDSEMFSE